jgi:hypothetical protein
MSTKAEILASIEAAKSDIEQALTDVAKMPDLDSCRWRSAGPPHTYQSAPVSWNKVDAPPGRIDRS